MDFLSVPNDYWAASSEFGTYSLCEQRRFRRACASAQSRQNLRCSLIQALSQEEPLDRKPDPWPLWMAGHAQLKFVMMDCSKTQIGLMRAAKVQASLRIRAVSPEPSLLAHTSIESRGTFRQKARSLAPLNGWACAVKICHDGMLEDTNSLDGARLL